MRFIINIALLIFFIVSGIAQTRELIIKAALIEKLTEYIEWNDKLFDEHNDFIIGITGNRTIAESLVIIYSERKIKSKKVKVKILNKVSEINDCDLIFFTGSPDNEIVENIENDKNLLPLIITDYNCNIQNSHLQLLLEEDKINFKLNVSTFDSTHFTFSYLLLNYARNEE